MHRTKLFVLILTLTLLGGCASYVTPGRAADMQAFGVSDKMRENLTDAQIRAQLDRVPLAQFPTALAVVRVQDPNYRRHGCSTYGHGRYTVVTSRDVETQAHLERLAKLPMVRGVAPVTRLLLPAELQSDRELRGAAAALHADITLIYTIDTAFRIGKMSSPIDVITLGFLPSKRAYVTTSASAVLLDTRNGYVYGVAEATAEHDQMANTWTSEKAIDDCRIRTEGQAIDQLVGEIERTWSAMLKAQNVTAQAR